MNFSKLIFLHGWGMSPVIFDTLFDGVDGNLPLANVALPGYPGSRWTLEQGFDQQVEQMARDLPAGELLGWSMGGIYAIELAARYPEKFTQLTLVSSNPCFVKRSAWQCAVEADVFDAFCEQLTNGWQPTLRRFISLQMLGESDAREQVRRLTGQLVLAGEPSAQVLNFGLELLKQQDCRESLAQLQQPVRLLLGERDALVPHALSQQIGDVNPRIQVESLPGAAHIPFLSHKHEFMSLLATTA